MAIQMVNPKKIVLSSRNKAALLKNRFSYFKLDFRNFLSIHIFFSVFYFESWECFLHKKYFFSDFIFDIYLVKKKFPNAFSKCAR